MVWPETPEALVDRQHELAMATPPSFTTLEAMTIAGVFVCGPFALEGAGARGDPLWAGAATMPPRGTPSTAVIQARAGWSYEAGLLALREGPALEAAVRRLPSIPDVLLVNATGRDHPRRAGLALHLGAVLDLPTVGVTHRPLLATGPWPGPERGSASPLTLDAEVVGAWVTTQTGRRPLAVNAAWRTDVATAVAVVLASVRRTRTPHPLTLARTAARRARARCHVAAD